jgi:Di- and tricarboxylate transporters
MTLSIALVFLLILIVFLLFLWEAVPPDLVAIGVLVVVTLVGWITPAEAFLSFSNEAPITVAAMFILSAGLQRCGAIEDIGRMLRRMPHMTETKLIVVLMASVAACSAFINNTPVVVAFLPLVLGVARHYHVSASKLLIPLSFAAILGGTCTLIGTSTNLVVSSLARDRYNIDFGIFDIAKLGLLVAVSGIGYMALIGRRLLPDRESLASLVNSSPMREYIAEMLVAENSPLRGQRLEDTELHKIANVRVQGILRNDELLPNPLHDVVLHAGDRLVLGAPRTAMLEVHAIEGIDLVDEEGLGLERVRTENAVVVEAVVTNNSHFAGRTLRESRLRENFHALVVAIHRHGENITRNVGTVPLQFGDTLLLRISTDGLARLNGNPDLLLLTDTVVPTARREKRPIVLAILALVIVLATTGLYPISILALAGVVAMVATRCLRMSEVYDAIDWRIVAMIVGMISLGTAMENTGAAQWLVDRAVSEIGTANPILVLGVFYLIATVLTEFISNNAVAVLLTPIAYQTSVALELNPVPFFVAIMFAASASFATPIGYQTNTFVYGAGGYKFRDFLRVGIPLNVLFLFEVTLLIPLFWPLK